MSDDARRVGANVRRIRLSQGMSLDVLAGRAEVSKSGLSRIENGNRNMSRDTRDKIAAALRCDISDLLGQPFPAHGRTQSRAHAKVPALRRVLHGVALGYGDPPVRPITDLTEDAARLWLYRRQCDNPAVAQLLPTLLEGLHVHAAHGDHQRDAQRLVVEVSSAAAFSLRALGYADLAWTAAQQCHAAAVQLGDPVAVGFADFTRAQAASLGPGFDGALRVAEGAADELRPRLTGDPEDDRVYGTLLATCAWAAAATRHYDRVPTYLNEARRVAARVGDADPAGDRWQTYFGPSNLGIWEMGVAVDTGNGGNVEQLARGVNLAVLDTRSRRAQFWSDYGRGLAQIPGRETDAADAFLRADGEASARTRNNIAVRETVAAMLDRVTRRSVGQKLTTLAGRMAAK